MDKVHELTYEIKEFAIRRFRINWVRRLKAAFAAVVVVVVVRLAIDVMSSQRAVS